MVGSRLLFAHRARASRASIFFARAGNFNFTDARFVAYRICVSFLVLPHLRPGGQTSRVVRLVFDLGSLLQHNLFDLTRDLFLAKV